MFVKFSGLTRNQEGHEVVSVCFVTFQHSSSEGFGSVRSIMCRTLFDKLNDLGQVKSIEPTTIQCITAAQTTLPMDMMASI